MRLGRGGDQVRGMEGRGEGSNHTVSVLDKLCASHTGIKCSWVRAGIVLIKHGCGMATDAEGVGASSILFNTLAAWG